MKNLIKIQAELKCPKGSFNAFGKYKYRSAEKILEALNRDFKSASFQFLIIADCNSQNWIQIQAFLKIRILTLVFYRQKDQKFYQLTIKKKV